MKVLAIDFEGVIHEYEHPIEGRRMGAIINGARQALEFLKKRGDRIIVFSVWGHDKGRKTIADFMNYYYLPFDEITNIKPQADYYIDDRGIKFTNWEEVLKQL